MSAATKKEQAFTLIEVMLAFALLALMLLILYSSFALGSRAEERVATRITANEKIRAVEGLLAAYIRSAYPYRRADGSVNVVFDGTEDSLSFVSAVSALSGERGLATITIAFTADGQGHGTLTLEETLPVRLGGGEESQENEEVLQSELLAAENSPQAGGNGGITNEVVLADQLTRVHISYLEVTEDTEEWLFAWDGAQKGQMPRAVRIILEADGVEPAEWVFPIMIRLLSV